MATGSISIQEKQLEHFQDKLRKIRSVIGWSGSDLAELIDVTRQTVNNLETGKSQLTGVQFLAIGAAVDRAQHNAPELRSIVAAILADFPRATLKGGSAPLSLLDAWFSFFPEKFTISSPHTDALRSLDLLESITQGHMVFLSPDLLFFLDARECVEGLIAMMQEYGNAPLVPVAGLREHLSQCEDKADETVLWFNELKQQGKIRLVGRENDPPLVETLISQCIRLKKTHRLCLITRSEELADDVLALNALRSIVGYPVRAIILSGQGLFEERGYAQKKWAYAAISAPDAVSSGSNIEKKEDIPLTEDAAHIDIARLESWETL